MGTTEGLSDRSFSNLPTRNIQGMKTLTVLALVFGTVASQGMDNTFPWVCIPGLSSPIRNSPSNDPECMSSNGRDCVWTGSDQGCNERLARPIDNIVPLVCGTMHSQVWGSPGYKNPKHWCFKSRAFFSSTPGPVPDLDTEWK